MLVQIIFPHPLSEHTSYHLNPIQMSSEHLNQSQTPAIIMSFNNSRRNKNLIGFIGLFQLSVIVIILWYLVLGSRYGWLNQADAEALYLFLFCYVPVIMTTIYFMLNPKHFKRVLNDMFM